MKAKNLTNLELPQCVPFEASKPLNTKVHPGGTPCISESHLGVAGHVAVEVLGLSEACLRMRHLALRPLAQPGVRQLGHNVPLAGVQAAGGEAVT